MKGTSFTPDVSVCQVESNLPGEDRYVCRVTEDILTYGIYDGHGGYLAADIACATLQDMIIADIQSVAVECRSNLKIAEIIDAAFITVDDMIIAQALRLHRLSKESSVKTKPSDGEGSNKTAKFMGRAGSCAAVVIITGGMLFVAHVGDCRAVIIRDEEDESVPSVESPPSQSQQSNLYHNTSPTCSHLELGSNKKQKLTNDISLSTTHSLEENDSNNTISKIDKNQFQIYDSLLFDSKDNKENIATSEKRNVRRKSSAPKEKTAKDFSYTTPYGITAEGITLDHSCDVLSEVEAIKKISSDPNPIRPSESDKRALGYRAPLRVGGSLAITRAFGDSYLKLEELSTIQYSLHIPYIVCKPTITYRPLKSSDKGIILASDGLWNFIKARDCACIMASHISENSTKNVEERINDIDPHEGDMEVKTGELKKDHVNVTIYKERKLKKFLTDNRSSHSNSIVEERNRSTKNSRDPALTPNSSSCCDCNSSSSSNNSSSSARRKSDTAVEISANNANASTLTDDFCGNIRIGEPRRDDTDDSNKSNSESQRSKTRSAKVEWSNSIINHEYLFTLDSHVASEPLNYYTGFVPLVTATANTIITSSTDDYISYSNNDDDDNINKAKISDEEVAIDYWHGENMSPIKPSGDNDVNDDVSILKVSCDIGNSCKEGSYVGHKIVTNSKYNCNDGIENHRILQIQTTACGGLQSAPRTLRGVDKEKDFDSNRFGSDSDDSMSVQAGNRIKDSKVTQDDTFEGDFSYDYYDNNNSNYYDMKISINKGPALTLMDKCLDLAASSNFSGLTGAELKAIPQGPGRRAMIDDVTIMVLTFK